jgi:hypothetical protein
MENARYPLVSPVFFFIHLVCRLGCSCLAFRGHSMLQPDLTLCLILRLRA